MNIRLKTKEMLTPKMILFLFYFMIGHQYPYI